MFELSRPYPEEELTPPKPSRPERAPSLVTFTIDHDGTEIALVPVHGSPAPAKLYADDYRIMIRLGVSPHWSLTKPRGTERLLHRHVHCASGCEALVHTRSGSSHVARMVAQAGVGEKVFHRDKNTLNLRLDNLRIT